MRSLMRALVIAPALTALIAGITAASMQTPPRQLAIFPSAVFRAVATPSRYFYLDKSVVEYAPGAVLGAGTERAVRFVTVVDGNVTFAVGGKTETYGAGKGFSVAPGVVLAARNESGATARVVVSSLVPAGSGAAPVAHAPSTSSAPRILSAMRMPVGPLPETIDVIQGGTRYEPGFATGLHVMNETHAILHLEGTTSYEYVDGARESFGPGQGGQMYVGRPGLMANRTFAPSAFVITWLVIPGKPLTSPWTHSH